jgi:hypothetical protein
MQLDIFNDSRDVMLRNDVLSALQRYDAAGARRALQALANEYPDDVAQVYFGSIVNALEGRSTVPFDRHEAALQARQALSHEVQPAVARGSRGRAGHLARTALGRTGRTRHCAAFPCGPRGCARGAALPACCAVGRGLRCDIARRVLATDSSAALLDDGGTLPARWSGRGLAVAGGTCVAFSIPV